MNVKLMQDIIHELFDTYADDDFDLAKFITTTFEDAGLLTEDKGILVYFKEGKTFAITITEK